MPQDLTIRKIVAADVEEVAAMWSLLARQHAQYDPQVWQASPHATQRWQRMLTEAMEDPQSVALVAQDPTGRLLGFTVGKVRQAPEVYPPGLVGEIWDLFVHPDARGRGLGCALTEAAVDALDALGARSVQLHVAQANRAAQALYEKVGFRAVMHRMYIALPRKKDTGGPNGPPPATP